MGLSDHDDPVNKKPSGPVKVNSFQRKTEVRKGIILHFHKYGDFCSPVT